MTAKRTRWTPRLPIWVRVPLITLVVLVAIFLSPMLLDAAGLAGGGHGSGDATEDGAGHGSGDGGGSGGGHGSSGDQ